MAAELDKLAREFEQHPEGNGLAKALRGLANIARQLGVPESFETPQPRGIEIPGVNEETYRKIREAVEATGYTFVVPIRSVSVENLITDDEQRGQKGEARRLGYVNDSETMRTTVPPEMEIAINPTRLRIEYSNNLSTERQKEMIKTKEVRFEEQLPSGVRRFVSMRMVDPSTLSQLEGVYTDETGKFLFPDYFVRTDVETVYGRVAIVGRGGPADRRHVHDWPRVHGGLNVFAVPVVVLPRKLVA